MGQCCGAGDSQPSDHEQAWPPQTRHHKIYDPKSMPDKNIGFEEGTPAPPVPPPLVPDAKAVYDLIEGENDVCPTCLEEYTDDNPKMTSECQHSFHLVRLFIDGTYILDREYLFWCGVGRFSNRLPRSRLCVCVCVFFFFFFFCLALFLQACIYEWLERSPYCPVCAQRMKLPRLERARNHPPRENTNEDSTHRSDP
mmetsp:Transcript_7862/g.16848  ORF Transcript_7862/g.16848 Transcript_7862/m.16848 type:complete len:197 (+) Transcript_7862:132-722(+)